MVNSALDISRAAHHASDPLKHAEGLAERSAVKRTAKAKAKAKTRKRKAKKQLPVCTKKDLKTKKSKRRKCRVVKKKPTKVTATSPKVVTPSPSGALTAPPAASASPDAFPTAPVAERVDGLRTFRGTFGAAQAQRLLFRAGFGPRPGQAEALAAAGVEGAVAGLMDPGAVSLDGPAPTGDYLVAGALAPADRWGHLHLATFDRQIRSTDQLGERMTLVLHDWFAVSENGSERKLMPRHLELLRKGWRGSFRQLLLDVTQDPAMLLYLDSVANRKGSPNENYARELMELYALGADRGAYTETDVREMARALTGFRADWADATGFGNFRYDATRHDTGVKTVFAGTAAQRSGNLTWQDAVNAVVDHPLHASFVVRKLWSYFIPTEPTAVTQAELEALYRSSGEQLAPLVRAILLHPDLHQGASMVKPPCVFAAGLLRSTGQGLINDSWVWRLNNAGQQLGLPPNVAGWDDRGWLNTSSHAARWAMVAETLRNKLTGAADYTGQTETPDVALDRALAIWGRPQLSDDHVGVLRAMAAQTWVKGVAGDYGSMTTFLVQRQNTLRHVVAAASDFQVS